jgi:hypothetical protein
MLLQNLPGSPTPSAIGPLSPIDLISSGWTFVAEPTKDNRWKVFGHKGQTVVTAHAVRLGEAFQAVEREHESTIRSGPLHHSRASFEVASRFADGNAGS